MRIGTSLALVAVGLILAYAVDFELPGIDVRALGSILFYVGLLGLALAIGLEVLAARRRRAPRPRRRKAPPREEAVRRPAYDPVVRPGPRDPSEDETRRLPPR